MGARFLSFFLFWILQNAKCNLYAFFASNFSRYDPIQFGTFLARLGNHNELESESGISLDFFYCSSKCSPDWFEFPIGLFTLPARLQLAFHVPIDFQPSGIWFPDPLTLFSPFCHPDSLTQLIMCTIIVPQCTQCDNATKLNARRCDVIMQQNAAPVVNPLGCIGIHYSPPLPPHCPSMASVILSPARTNVYVSDIPHWDEQIKKWPNYLQLHASKTGG